MEYNNISLITLCDKIKKLNTPGLWYCVGCEFYWVDLKNIFFIFLEIFLFDKNCLFTLPTNFWITQIFMTRFSKLYTCWKDGPLKRCTHIYCWPEHTMRWHAMRCDGVNLENSNFYHGFLSVSIHSSKLG